MIILKELTPALDKMNKQKEKGQREGTKNKSTCFHTQESNKNTKLEIKIYPQRTCRVKREKKKKKENI